jgi:hypothetical protein
VLLFLRVFRVLVVARTVRRACDILSNVNAIIVVDASDIAITIAALTHRLSDARPALLIADIKNADDRSINIGLLPKPAPS